jgi:hypothetical protein
MTHHPFRPWDGQGRNGSVRPVTWLWALLIVIGLAMVVVAVWPSIRGGKKGDSEAD